MLKHTRNLILCGIKIEFRAALNSTCRSYLGVNESEVFLKSVYDTCIHFVLRMAEPGVKIVLVRAGNLLIPKGIDTYLLAQIELEPLPPFF